MDRRHAQERGRRDAERVLEEHESVESCCERRVFPQDAIGHSGLETVQQHDEHVPDGREPEDGGRVGRQQCGLS